MSDMMVTSGKGANTLGIRNGNGNANGNANRDENDTLGGWRLDSNLTDNFRPITGKAHMISGLSMRASDDVLIEVIYCGESPDIPEEQWQKFTDRPVRFIE